MSGGKVDFRRFGVESKVQQNLTIILEPMPYDKEAPSSSGIYPEQSRNRLVFTRNGDKALDPPMAEWASNLPGPCHPRFLMQFCRPEVIIPAR